MTETQTAFFICGMTAGIPVGLALALWIKWSDRHFLDRIGQRKPN